jgi:predicted RNA polymerase sigma factor
MGRHAEAGEQYARAVRLAGNTAEREFLTRRIAELQQE